MDVRAWSRWRRRRGWRAQHQPLRDFVGQSACATIFFTAAITSRPLTALSTATAGGNGVYAYGGTGAADLFPTNTFDADDH
jgi:hypothetical protein